VRVARSAQPPALADSRRPRGRCGLSGPVPRPRALVSAAVVERILSVAVASFQPAAVVYREEQNFDWRAYALVLVLESLLWAILFWQVQKIPNHGLMHRGALEIPVGIAVCVALPLVLVVGF